MRAVDLLGGTEILPDRDCLELLRGESVGRVGGVMNFATQIAAISAPVITGYFARAHNFGGSFALAAMVLAIGIAGYVLGLGKLRVIPEPA